jgi:hypothetical protein
LSPMRVIKVLMGTGSLTYRASQLSNYQATLGNRPFLSSSWSGYDHPRAACRRR